MSKKKQLSGKKTKLAKLPLTEALSRQMDGPEHDAPENDAPVAVPEPKSPQPTFSWERIEEGAAGLLTAAYFLVVQDLMSLRNEVPWASDEELPPGEVLPTETLPAQQVKQALRQAREELSDLHRILSG
jgi:hypothetical protein